MLSTSRSPWTGLHLLPPIHQPGPPGEEFQPELWVPPAATVPSVQRTSCFTRAPKKIPEAFLRMCSSCCASRRNWQRPQPPEGSRLSSGAWEPARPEWCRVWALGPAASRGPAAGPLGQVMGQQWTPWAMPWAPAAGTLGLCLQRGSSQPKTLPSLVSLGKWGHSWLSFDTMPRQHRDS